MYEFELWAWKIVICASPITVSAIVRTFSNALGFFFWGMMLLMPVRGGPAFITNHG